MTQKDDVHLSFDLLSHRLATSLRLLTLPSNERIRLLPHMRLIFEIRDLKHATPATATRAGILYISEGMQWSFLVASWLQRVVRYLCSIQCAPRVSSIPQAVCSAQQVERSGAAHRVAAGPVCQVHRGHGAGNAALLCACNPAVNHQLGPEPHRHPAGVPQVRIELVLCSVLLSRLSAHCHVTRSLGE